MAKQVDTDLDKKRSEKTDVCVCQTPLINHINCNQLGPKKSTKIDLF